jgi:epoxyqueuosine reductase
VARVMYALGGRRDRRHASSRFGWLCKIGGEFFATVVGPFARRAVVAKWSPAFRHVPSLPSSLRRGTQPHFGRWPGWTRDLPEALRSYAGIRRDADEEREAFRSRPLRAFTHEYKDELEWAYQSNWKSMFLALPRIQRAIRAVDDTWTEDAADAGDLPAAEGAASEELTREVKEFAAEIGLSAVGIAAYDPKMMFEEFSDRRDGDRVIVCILEQNFEATQTIPSQRADRATWSCIAEVSEFSARIAGMLQERGYRAHANEIDGEGVSIAYAVQAGLGQLGLNGQLLTPASGSRCRITMVTTDAPLSFDEPVDYGIPEICDRCRACVRRCPSKALTSKRLMHRGVEKGKVNTARCMPVLEAANNCAICMKVCPVQRYGLPAVVEEFERSGEILGTRTDELEGYTWPLDGRHYGPGERPPLSKDFFSQPLLERLPGAGTATNGAGTPATPTEPDRTP